MPVRPPSLIPEADSTKAVSGDEPISDPTTDAIPSVQYAMVMRGKVLSGRMKPAGKQKALIATTVHRHYKAELHRCMFHSLTALSMHGTASFNSLSVSLSS